MALAEQTNTNAVEETVLTVTPAAVAVIKELLQKRNIPDYYLRVFVTGGGCSGMQYGMAFEQAPQDYDRAIRVDDGVKLLIDPTSLIYLKGVLIDYVDSLIGGGFRIDNPNAVSTCGCGTSFKTGQSADTETGGCGTCSSY